MTAAFSTEPVVGGEVARLDALDVVRGQRREEHDADDRDHPGDLAAGRKMLITDATMQADEAHEQDAADASERALRDRAVDGRRAEHRRRATGTPSRPTPRCTAETIRPIVSAERRRVDEEQAERERWR